MSSIVTNSSAMTALRVLNNISSTLSANQQRLTTGMKVGGSRDDAAGLAVAQSIRNDASLQNTASAYASLNTGISQAKGAVDVATVAATGIASMLEQTRGVLTKLADTTLSADARDSAQQSYAALRTQIVNFANDATYNGFNALGDQTQNVATSVNGSTYAIGGLDVKGAVETLSAEVMTADDAQAMLASDGTLASVESKVGEALNTLETNARQLSAQMKFTSAVEDSRQAGLGALVDTNMGEESARLQSLQIQQQLGTQSLGIANQAPQILLSLFR